MTDSAVRYDNLASCLFNGDGLPVGVDLLTQRIFELGGAHQPIRHEVAILFHQTHQIWHVGVFAAVVLEILGLAIEMKFPQNHMSHSHGQCGISPLLGMQPDV